MTEEEIERVAEAISTKTYAVVRGTDDCGKWHEYPDCIRAIYRDAARAAIAAFTTPNPHPITRGGIVN